MKETNFWITSLLNVDAIKCVLKREIGNLYLIGSAVHRQKINDIDIALIFFDYFSDAEFLIQWRKTARKEIKQMLGLEADIMILSEAEAQDTKFFSMPTLLVS